MMIAVDSDKGKGFGFTSDKWEDDSYLWMDEANRRVLLSLVIARYPGKGALTDLIKSIEVLGLKVAVPCPLAQMKAILRKWDFRPNEEWSDATGEPIDVWERNPII